MHRCPHPTRLHQDCPHVDFESLKSDAAISRLSVCRPHSAIEQASCATGIGRPRAIENSFRAACSHCILYPVSLTSYARVCTSLVTHTPRAARISGRGRRYSLLVQPQTLFYRPDPTPPDFILQTLPSSFLARWASCWVRRMGSSLASLKPR